MHWVASFSCTVYGVYSEVEDKHMKVVVFLMLIAGSALYSDPLLRGVVADGLTQLSEVVR